MTCNPALDPADVGVVHRDAGDEGAGLRLQRLQAFDVESRHGAATACVRFEAVLTLSNRAAFAGAYRQDEDLIVAPPRVVCEGWNVLLRDPVGQKEDRSGYGLDPAYEERGVNATWLLLIALVWYGLGYRFYGRRLARIVGVDEKRTTPAYSREDGIDFVPAKNWFVLFGHHFSSICGAGPIIGPALAVAYWGWAPSLVWLLLGAVLMGAVADFTSLFVSVRSDETVQ